MRKIIPFFIILYGCNSTSISLQPSALLETRLVEAKKRKIELEKKVSQLETALAKSEIARIQKQIVLFDLTQTSFEKNNQFAAEREKLVAIIQNNPFCAEEAQKVLDQILSLITQLSNN